MVEWTTIKPELKDGCTLVTGTLIKKWHYKVWVIKTVNYGDGPYLALLEGDGEEWGDIDDLTADKYLIIPNA